MNNWKSYDALIYRVLISVSLAIVLATLCWFLWGVNTRGDFFANGNMILIPSILFSIIIGLLMGYRVKKNWIKIMTLFLLTIALIFWFFIPSDWWVKPPM